MWTGKFKGGVERDKIEMVWMIKAVTVDFFRFFSSRERRCLYQRRSKKYWLTALLK